MGRRAIIDRYLSQSADARFQLRLIAEARGEKERHRLDRGEFDYRLATDVRTTITTNQRRRFINRRRYRQAGRRTGCHRGV